jgi:hypothetical protein
MTALLFLTFLCMPQAPKASSPPPSTVTLDRESGDRLRELDRQIAELDMQLRALELQKENLRLLERILLRDAGVSPKQADDPKCRSDKDGLVVCLKGNDSSN